MILARQMGYAEAAEFLEARFASYLDPETDPDLQATYDHDPQVFQEGFPALTVEEIGSAGQDRWGLPEVMVFNVRVYAPSLYGSLGLDGTFDVSRDAISQAKRLTRSVHERWRKAFKEDRDLIGRRVAAGRVASTTSGDADQFGNRRTNPTEGGFSILWVHSSRVEIVMS